MCSIVSSIATIASVYTIETMTTLTADEVIQCEMLVDEIDKRVATPVNELRMEFRNLVRNELYNFLLRTADTASTPVAPPSIAQDYHDGMDEDNAQVEAVADKDNRILSPPKKRLREAFNTPTTSRRDKNAYEPNVVLPSNPVVSKSPNDKFLLCDNSIILFVGEQNEAVRTDVTNSLILAQLNADKQMLAFKQKVGASIMPASAMEEWMRVFQETFAHIGWVDTGFEVTRAQAVGNDLSMEKILLNVIDAIGNGEEKTTFRKAMAVLKTLPNEDEKISLFRRRTVEKDFTQFLVHLVYIDGRGSATMKTSMLCVSTKQAVTNVLWFTWSDTGTQVFKAEHTMMLGARSFDLIRPTIVKKVLQINETYVNAIPF